MPVTSKQAALGGWGDPYLNAEVDAGMANMQEQLNRHLWSYKSGVSTEVFKVMNNILNAFEMNSKCGKGCSGDLNMMEGTCSVLKS